MRDNLPWADPENETAMCAMIRKARASDLPSILALYSEIEKATEQPTSL
jgi:hypothetical protein